MASTVATAPPSQAERLAQRIKEHKEEVARLRAEIGDPAEALDTFIRERFDIQAIFANRRPGPEGYWTLLEEEDDDLDAR